jgi:hypothetical protein
MPAISFEFPRVAAGYRIAGSAGHTAASFEMARGLQVPIIETGESARQSLLAKARICAR